MVILIPGKPIPKGRPRRSKGGHFYTPPETQVYEYKVGFCSLVEKGKIKKGEKCKLVIRIYFKGKQKGDIDNIEKALLDGMEGIVYDNDKQVKEKHTYILENQSEDKVEIEVYKI